MQNSLTELWALLKFLIQDIFDSLGVFESCFNEGKMQEGSDERILRQERKGQVISTLMKVRERECLGVVWVGLGVFWGFL